MKTVTYDPEVFKQHAEYLYSESDFRQQGV